MIPRGERRISSRVQKEEEDQEDLMDTNISHFWKGDEDIVLGFRKEIDQFTMCIVKNHVSWIRIPPAIS